MGLLLGVDLDGGSAALLGGLMVVLASLGYALGAFYLKSRFAGTKPIGTVTVTMGASALMTLPFALASLPLRRRPTSRRSGPSPPSGSSAPASPSSSSTR